MTRYMSTTAAAIAALAMSGSVTLAQEATTFDFFADTQMSEEIAYTDFNVALSEARVFERFDVDTDESLTADELGRGFYATYDVDQDELLTTDEIVGMGRDPIFRDEPWGENEADAPDELAYTDFEARVADRPVWVGWDMDADGVISRDEFTQGLFATYDVDQNEMLDIEEREAMRESRILQW